MNVVHANVRWFRFSLRTFFVIVTMLAVGLAWLLSDIVQRRVARAWIERRGGAVDVFALPQPIEIPFEGTSIELQYGGGQRALGPEDEPEIPRWRRWFGDVAYNRIIMPKDSSQAEIDRMKALFPEAEVEITSTEPSGGGLF